MGVFCFATLGSFGADGGSGMILVAGFYYMTFLAGETSLQDASLRF
jgi:hypothetical protein